MKAWLLDSLNGVDGLRIDQVPDPVPAAGEVLLQVRYAALNPADRYLAENQYPARPPLPHVLGRDGLGAVLELGPGVEGLRPGDVMTILRGEAGVSRWGAFAEKVIVSADALVDPPEGWSDPQAAAAPLVYVTAHQALTQWGDLPPSVVLVTGASGGVGVASIQLGKAMGHTVLALSRGASKRDALKALGAAGVFDPTDSDWRKQVRTFLAGRRVDLAIDNIGGQLFSDLLDTLGEGGKVSVVGRLAGAVPQFNTSSLLFRRLRVGGVAIGSYSPAESQSAWRSVVQTLGRTGARPVIDSVYAFEELPNAFARLKEGPVGKVLLEVRQS